MTVSETLRHTLQRLELAFEQGKVTHHAMLKKKPNNVSNTRGNKIRSETQKHFTSHRFSVLQVPLLVTTILSHGFIN